MPAAKTKTNLQPVALPPKDGRGLQKMWAGHCHYEDHEPFYLGTVVLPHDARLDEVEKALADLWAEISPHPAPRIVPQEGRCIFIEGND